MSEIEFEIDLPEVITVDPNKTTTSITDPVENTGAVEVQPVTPEVVTSSVNDDIPFYVSILEQSGLELSDEDLALFDNKEDNQETLQETIDFVINRKLDSKRQTILSEFPELEEVYATLKTTGSIESYIQNKQKAIDFNNVRIKNDDIYTQRQVAKEYLKLKNIEDDVADEMIKSYESNNNLESFSKKALESVKSHYSNVSQKAKEEMAAMQQREQEEYMAQVNNAKELVKKGTLTNIQLPKNDGEQLVDYVYKVDKDGASQYQKDISQLNQEQILAIAYLIKNKLDFSKVIQSQIKTEKAKSIRDMLNSATKPGQRQTNQSKSTSPISFSDLEIA